MGQAKRRGTFEDRKAESIELQKEKDKLRVMVDQRRSSPKHTAMMLALAEMTGAHIYTKH